MNDGLLITIATYNEIDNLPALMDELLELLPGASVLIVDDDSPDGTSDWVTLHREFENKVFLIRRVDARGLGSATLAGLNWGLERNFDHIATLDADFSHPPADLLAMYENVSIDSSLDAVVGSRYVIGGGIEGWPLMRRVGSKIVNGIARFWLGLKTRDNTGALRIYRASSLRKLNLNNVKSDGYGYLEEILLLLQRSNAKVVEHPFVFVDRRIGQSKLSVRVGLNVLLEIFWMRFKK